MLKVLHLATQDQGGGGGGFDSAYRLHRNMRSFGLDSRMLVLRKASRDEHVTGVENRLGAAGWLKAAWSKVQRKYLHRKFRPSIYFAVESSSKPVSAARLFDLLPFKPDVIIAHWISGFVTAQALRELHALTNAPIVWYLIDMSPLTGGCHYSFDCSGYMRSCGDCPQLSAQRGASDLSHRQWADKSAAFRDTDITAVAASSWLLHQVEACSVFKGKRHAMTLLGIDVDVFRPADQAHAREALRLPRERRIIFFGAHNLQEERKGLKYLAESLELLHESLADDPRLRANVLVVTAGNGGGSGEWKIPFERHHVGFLRGDAQLASAYQSADIFLNASIADAGPMMVNESILCGTPVVCFDMGIARDIVHTDETGYRANLMDAADMAGGLHRILAMEHAAYRAMRERCRALGVEKFHPAVQVRAFEALCTELLTASPRSTTRGYESC